MVSIDHDILLPFLVIMTFFTTFFILVKLFLNNKISKKRKKANNTKLPLKVTTKRSLKGSPRR